MKKLCLQPIVLFCAVMLVAGCSLPGPRERTISQHFMLDGGRSHEPNVQVSRTCLDLRVSSPGSAPGFGTSRMAYINAPPRLDYFAHHAWVDAPARMLETLLVTRLDRAGMFGAILSGAQDVRTELRLDSELQRLVQTFDESGSAVSLEIRVVLINNASRSLAGSRTFSYLETADDENPLAGVAAANRAANRFVDDLLEFLGDTIDSYECPP
ncbi:MAG TPA: ABC-type transport auxiliary lipoprotein family protein [Woeseiaceae bacterium]